jgi:thiamine kinase
MNSPILKLVNGYLRETPAWRPLDSTGSSNRLYESVVRGQRVVLRVNADNSQAFGVDRGREAQVLSLIAPFDWAPVILHNDTHQGWCLMRHHGASLCREALAEGLALKRLVKEKLLLAIGEWQAVRAGPRYDYAALLDAYRVRLSIDGISHRPLLTQLIAKIVAEKDRLPVVHGCLTHHDLHLANLCWHDNRLTVLDWEYGGIGNPWFDAAALQQQFNVSLNEIAALPAFQAVSVEAMYRGMRHARRMVLGLEYLWYGVRGLQGTALTRAELVTGIQTLLEGGEG